MKSNGSGPRHFGFKRGSFVGRQLGFVRSALGGSSLRRPVDRWEALLRIALWLLAVVATALVVLLSTGTVERAAQHNAAEAASRHPVHAVVVRQVPPSTPSPQSTGTSYTSTQVRWQVTDGSWRFGEAEVPTGTEVGARTVVWINGTGQIVTKPASASDAMAKGVGWGMALEAGALGALWLTGSVTRRALDRRRLVEWERDWVTADTRWRGRGKQNPQ